MSVGVSWFINKGGGQCFEFPSMFQLAKGRESGL